MTQQNDPASPLRSAQERQQALDKADGRQDCLVHKDKAAAFLKEEQQALDQQFKEQIGRQHEGQTQWETSFMAALLDNTKKMVYQTDPSTPEVQRVPNCKPGASTVVKR